MSLELVDRDLIFCLIEAGSILLKIRIASIPARKQKLRPERMRRISSCFLNPICRITWCSHGSLLFICTALLIEHDIRK